MKALKPIKFVLFFFNLVPFARAQSLQLGSPTQKKSGVLEVGFYAYDDDGNAITGLTPFNVEVQQNGVPQKVIKVIDQEPGEVEPLSVVFGLDVSGSMSYRVEMINQAVAELAREIPMHQTEVALTSFNNSQHVPSDFTRDPSRIVQSVNRLSSGGGTDYDASFSSPGIGTLDMVDKAVNKPCVIFITDGYGNFLDGVIDEAKAKGVAVHVLVVNSDGNEELELLTRTTGGQFFNKLQTSDEIKAACHKVLGIESMGGMGKIIFEQTPDCRLTRELEVRITKELTSVKGDIEFRDQAVNDQLFTTLPNIEIEDPRALTDTVFHLFSVRPNCMVTKVHTNIDGLKLGFPEAPFFINASAHMSVTVKGQGFRSGEISIAYDNCPEVVIPVHVSENDGKHLNVVTPNGGETLYVGSSEGIEREGLSGREVTISHSADAGKTWDVVQANDPFSYHNWVVPDMPGKEHLIKIEGSASDAKLKLVDQGKLSLRAATVFHQKTTWLELGNAYETEAPGKVLKLNDTMWGLIRGPAPDSGLTVGVNAPMLVAADVTIMPRFSGKERGISISNSFYTREHYTGLDTLHHWQANRDKDVFVLAGRHQKKGLTKLSVYSANSGALLYALCDSTSERLSFSVGNNLMAVRARGGYAVLDLSSGKKRLFIAGAKKVRVSPDDKLLLVQTAKGEVKKFATTYEEVTERSVDRSDAVFSIVRPELVTASMAFGRSLVGEPKVEQCETCVVNETPVTIAIEQATIVGKDAGAFRLLTPLSGEGLGGETGAMVEVQFFPTEERMYEATLQVKTPFEMKEVQLSGIGAPPEYEFSTSLIDMGTEVVTMAKDTLVEGAIRNVSDDTIHFEDIVLLLPEKNAFEMDSLVDVDLAPGESMWLQVAFRPTYRGKISGRIQLHTSAIGPEYLEVIGNAWAPDQYILEGMVVSSRSRSPLDARVTVTELDSWDDPFYFETGAQGRFGDTLKADRVYQVSIKKEGFHSLVDRVDLRVHSPWEVRRDTFVLEPLVAPSDSGGVHVYGHVKIPSKTAGKGWVICQHVQSREVASVAQYTSHSGAYNLWVPKSGDYELVYTDSTNLPERELLTIEEGGFYDHELEKELTKVKRGKAVVLDDVHFYRSRDRLTADSDDQLIMLVRYLKEHPKEKILLEGHTDNTGSARLNQKLSEQRAEKVKAYLIENGIPKRRIRARGFGGSKPIASNRREITRKLNRRVEFTIGEPTGVEGEHVSESEK